jgi:HEAT repeat protein
VSILKKKIQKKEKEEEDELEKILSQLKEEESDVATSSATVVTIQIAGLRELVEAVKKLAEALNRCGQ